MKPHLCHVFPAFATGGPEVRTTILLNALSGGFRHTVVSLSGDVSGQARLGPEADVQVRAEPSKGRWGHVGPLVRVLRNLRPDALLTYGWGGIDGIVAGRLCRVRHIIHAEDGFLPDEVHAQRLKRLMARRIAMRAASRVVLPSQTLVKIARETWWLPARRIQYVPNGVDTTRFSPGSSPEARRRFGLAHDELVVGTVGHLRSEKNQERLLRAFAEATRNVRARLLLVGDGPLRTSLQKLVADLGLEGRAVFTGIVQDPVDCYRAMDLFALSSDTEQMPIAVLEAMSMGLPVVSTDVGDVASMVSDGNRTFVTPLGRDAEYTRSLDTVLKDEACRLRLGHANRDRCVQEFSLGKMIEAYRRLYQEML